jgi:phospholipid/cholesterol/gamma-HCH transport system permease protein
LQERIAMPASVATVERQGRSAVVHLQGDVVAEAAPRLYGQLRAIGRRRDVSKVIVDFSKAGRVDSSGIAVISMVGRQLERAGKKFELDDLHPNHKAAFELVPTEHVTPEPVEVPGVLERMGAATLATGSSARELVRLILETGRQAFAVITRKKHLPAGSLATQIATMGVDGIFIVGLLSFLIGMTMGFQGAVQLQRFGADVFVADMIGVSVVRELAPLMTAVVLTGRTGAAIAAELGTMRVRSEIDALSTMGINPVRFLVVPRIASISFVGPALTLMGMFIGITGGMFVAKIALDMPLTTFWQRIAERVVLGDYIHGLGKSLVFAWIIGFAGSHLGMRARGDASSVGAATTRTVVASIFFIILVDAIFATISTLMKYS